MITLAPFQKCIDGSTYINQCNTSHKQTQGQKSHGHLCKGTKNTLEKRAASSMPKKLFDKIQYLFMIKSPKTQEIESAELNIIKAMYCKPIAIIILSGRTQSILTKIRKKIMVSTFSSLNVVLEVLAGAC